MHVGESALDKGPTPELRFTQRMQIPHRFFAHIAFNGNSISVCIARVSEGPSPIGRLRVCLFIWLFGKQFCARRGNLQLERD